jgi:hypothetical protein
MHAYHKAKIVNKWYDELFKKLVLLLCSFESCFFFKEIGFISNLNATKMKLTLSCLPQTAVFFIFV